MKKLLLALALLFGLAPAQADPVNSALVVSGCGSPPQAFLAGRPAPLTVDTNGINCTGGALASGTAAVTWIQGNGAGSTGAVVGTLAGVSGKTTYICGFSVSALGGTATVGPITIANTITASQVYQLASAVAGVTLAVPFSPCIPANAAATAITVTTTADGSATAVDVNSWGYQQ
jgi:hypothetical protein